MVNQKSMWLDLSSGKNGNIFDFLMPTEGLSFPEAVERLAAQAVLPVRRNARAMPRLRRTMRGSTARDPLTRRRRSCITCVDHAGSGAARTRAPTKKTMHSACSRSDVRCRSFESRS